MASQRTKPKILLTILLLAAILAPQLFVLVPTHHAKATLSVEVIGSVPADTFAITNTLGIGLISMDTIKKYIFDLLARIIAGTLLRAMTNQIVGWIQGDGGNNVGFVGNLDAALRKEVNLAGGEFLNNLTGIDLCSVNFRAYLQISLRLPGLSRRLGCTLSGIGANFQNFMSDFQNGGWPAFIKIGLEPQNNPYGGYLIALDAKATAEAAAGRRVQAVMQAGRGFLGGRGATRRCEMGHQSVYDLDDDGTPLSAPEQICWTEYNTSTPGGLVADTLSKTMNIGYDFAVVADEINEAIATIVNALITKLVSQTFSIINQDTGESESGSGLFTDELSELPFSAADLADHSIPQRADDMLFGADIVLTVVDQTAVQTQRELFAMRRQIEELLEQPITPDQQQKLAELKQKETELENKLNTALAQKDKVLAVRDEILTLKRSFQTSVSIDEFIAASNQIMPLVVRLNEVRKEIEDDNDDTTIPTAQIAIGDRKRDTINEIADAASYLTNSITALEDIRQEIDRIATSTSATAKQKADLALKRPEVQAAISRLQESSASLTQARIELENAFSDEEIKTALAEAISEIIASQNELERINAFIIELQPILKPE